MIEEEAAVHYSKLVINKIIRFLNKIN